MTARTIFVPTWKDKAGNRLFFMARNHIFDDANDAAEWQAAHALDYMAPWFLAPAGVKKIDVPAEFANVKPSATAKQIAASKHIPDNACRRAFDQAACSAMIGMCTSGMNQSSH